MVAKRGVQASHDFANLMSALMSDIIEQRITPAVGNAAVNAGGKLLKIVEMSIKYGSMTPGAGEKTLMLASAADKVEVAL